MNKATAEKIFARLAEVEPEPKTELAYTNDYTLLVAIVLSAQATDVSVNKATAELFKTVNTPAKMVKLGEAKLKQHIKTIGLFNAKAKNVMRLSHMLLDQYNGEIPPDRDLLQTLPGVGRKTANVWLNCARGQPTIAVDTHVQRVSNRTGLVKSMTPEQTETQLEKIIPDHWKSHAHHWLILHGRYVCKARRPECWRCVIADWCEYRDKQWSPDTPKKSGKTRATSRSRQP